MKLLDHGAEFVHLFAALALACVGIMRREESYGVVSPVVVQAFLLKERVIDELVYRHELYRVHPEFFQVFDDVWVCEACIGASDLRRHLFVQIGHATHMGFVDHAIRIWDVRVLVTAPIEERVDHGGLHHMRRGIEIVHVVGVVRVVEPI